MHDQYQGTFADLEKVTPALLSRIAKLEELATIQDQINKAALEKIEELEKEVNNLRSILHT